ncbi:MAG: polyprenyl synthetase family protein [Candidatus Lokiarchaeota archaeon]|nr:polyprenyl synthetase family protein [Candidatus Lokiarchaeota archaeon]
MKFLEYSEIYKSKINDVISFFYENKINSVDNEFLKNYYSELKEYFLAGGKRIRPLLCIAAYNAFSEKKDDRILTICVGTEFLHNASLIHDDIIDNDNFRRGEPTFHYRFQQYHKQYNLKRMQTLEFGTSMGILGGDSAYFIGMEPYLENKFNEKVNLEALFLYKQAFIEIANGVIIEIDMVNQRDINIDEYIEMISLKTGSLIEKSILIGATYANASKENKIFIGIYGMDLGIIFQIKDDILGTFGDEEKTGKPADSDIKEGKKTCLLIEALNKLDNDKKNELIEIFENPNMSDKEVERVRELYKEADVLTSCKNIADNYYKEAKESLNKLKSSINEDEFEVFEDLLEFVYEREY